MDKDRETRLRERVNGLALEWSSEAGEAFTGDDAQSYLPLIEAAGVVADQARSTLGGWVRAGRRGGLSWAEIGAVTGVSKQAAQQRFGTDGDDAPDPEGAVVVRLGATAFNEMAMLEREGREGRELIATGALKLFFRQTDQPWRYLRTVGAIDPRLHIIEHWQPVSTWFVFHYYKRPA